MNETCCKVLCRTWWGLKGTVRTSVALLSFESFKLICKNACDWKHETIIRHLWNTTNSYKHASSHLVESRHPWHFFQKIKYFSKKIVAITNVFFLRMLIAFVCIGTTQNTENKEARSDIISHKTPKMVQIESCPHVLHSDVEIWGPVFTGFNYNKI